MTKQHTWIADVQGNLPGGLEGAGAGLAALGKSGVCENEGEGNRVRARALVSAAIFPGLWVHGWDAAAQVPGDRTVKRGGSQACHRRSGRDR